MLVLISVSSFRYVHCNGIKTIVSMIYTKCIYMFVPVISSYASNETAVVNKIQMTYYWLLLGKTPYTTHK